MPAHDIPRLQTWELGRTSSFPFPPSHTQEPPALISNLYFSLKIIDASLYEAPEDDASSLRSSPFSPQSQVLFLERSMQPGCVTRDIHNLVTALGRSSGREPWVLRSCGVGFAFWGCKRGEGKMCSYWLICIPLRHLLAFTWTLASVGYDCIFFCIFLMQ